MVSVIIPYYNRPEKLKRCVDSILKQTYQNFEIIIIDDCSPTPLTLDDNDQIVIKRNTINSGPGVSRNNGMELAKGKYIAFLDCDDYWDKDFLEKCVLKHKTAKDVIMVYAQTLAVKEGIHIPKRDSVINSDIILPFILEFYRPWATSACVWKKSQIEDVEWASTRNWEDYAFDCAAATKNNKVARIEEYLVFYDEEGDDKLSKVDFLQKSIQKNLSLLAVYKSLKGTEFLNSPKLRTILIDNFILCLENIIKNNYSDSKLNNSNLIVLKELQSGLLYRVVKFTFKNMKNNTGAKVLNKIRKTFYSI